MSRTVINSGFVFSIPIFLFIVVDKILFFEKTNLPLILVRLLSHNELLVSISKYKKTKRSYISINFKF